MKHTVDYPFPSPDQNRFQRSVIERVVSALQTRKLQPAHAADVEVWPLRPEGVRPLRPSDLPLVFVIRDSIRFMPSFLRHYRRLGVTRFLCLEDNSTDGGRAYLAAQPDVDLFASNVNYKQASRSRAWREMLIGLHGYDRWYLNVDADEYFVYDRCETRSLRDLIAILERRGVSRCPAPMIDAYPSADLSAAKFDGSDDAYPWTVADLIDREGYTLTWNGKGLKLSGGVRRRIFGVDAEMMKYPLLYWRRDHSFGKTIHRPLPISRNFAPICGILLHFKIFDDFESDVRRIVEAGLHHNGSLFYKQIAAKLADGGPATLVSDVSQPIGGSEELAALGFFARLD